MPSQAHSQPRACVPVHTPSSVTKSHRSLLIPPYHHTPPLMNDYAPQPIDIQHIQNNFAPPPFHLPNNYFAPPPFAPQPFPAQNNFFPPPFPPTPFQTWMSIHIGGRWTGSPPTSSARQLMWLYLTACLCLTPTLANEGQLEMYMHSSDSIMAPAITTQLRTSSSSFALSPVATTCSCYPQAFKLGFGPLYMINVYGTNPTTQKTE